jgi:hypothetical protein
MKRYLRGVVGGILALLAAFGWTITLAFAIAWKYRENGKAYGLHALVLNGPKLWIILFVVFTAGFYFAFRKVY